MKATIGFIAICVLALFAGYASAQSYGSVKVECWGACHQVSLGEVCDTYQDGSTPVAIACDDTGVGSGWSTPCGTATCRPYGALVRSDRVSAYCDDGPGYDAIVTCVASSGAHVSDKHDDSAQ